MKNKLKVYRAMYDLTQEALAERLSITRQTVLSIEKAKYDPSLELAFKMAALFNVKIEDIIDMSLAFLRNEIEEKGIEVTKKFDSRVSIIRLDGDQMREVFDNIILNAIQATIDNGKIIISTNLLDKEKRIEVRITDNGIGISKEDQERIFTPFFTTKKGGTGLGLSISQRIISEHNGYISISSKQGKGSTMKMVLPINP